VLFALFEVGSLAFWIFFGLAAVLLTALTEHEKFGWASITALVSFGALALFGNFNVFSLALSHPLHVAYIVGAYFVAGALWSVAKWYFFVRERRRKYNDVRAKFLEAKGLPTDGPIPDEHKEAFSKNYDLKEYRNRPRIRDNKAIVTGWLAFWPVSAAWTLLNDPIRRIFEWIYETLHGVYEGISAYVYRGVEEDFKVASK
jgi:hypothetical protein